ncbi:unnamed protein product, partial [Effrenium voratum]
MGKVSSKLRRDAGEAAVKTPAKGVKKRIQKAGKVAPLAKAVTEGPVARRALVAAVSAAKAAKKRGDGMSDAKAVPTLGPRPKMNGARMMLELEEARAHAEKVAEVAQKGQKGSRRRQKLSQHRQD